MKSALVFWVTAALLVLAQFNDRRWKALEVFDWDAGGYYAYLPATFLYPHPPVRADVLVARLNVHKPLDHVRTPGVVPQPQGAVLPKYTLGMAVANAPWFAAAHGWARATGQPADGASRPYQQAWMVAGLFHGVLGLWLLRRLFQRLFFNDDSLVAWTLAGVGLGTTLFCYASFEAGMAHANLFLWQVALLSCTEAWYRDPRRRYAAGVGVFLGLAVLTRPTEMLYAVVPLAWGLTSWSDVRARWTWWKLHAGQVALAGLLFGVVVGLQPLYWRYQTGHWLVDTYQGEYFDFARPHLLDGLLSYRRGWLLYTPLAALMLAGAWAGPLRRRWPAAWLPTVLLVPAVLYLTFSWKQWWYGGGFGARPLISLYPLLSLGLAALLAAGGARGRGAWAGLRLAVALACVLNLWQTRQYNVGVIDYDNNTESRYWHNFFVGNMDDLRP